jgi:hypothetical protein
MSSSGHPTEKPRSASKEILLKRLRVSVPRLLAAVKKFLKEARKEGMSFSMPPEAEARAAAECLWHLGLQQDALHLAEGYGYLQSWVLGPGFNQVSANIVHDEPAKRTEYETLFGKFPSGDELEASPQHRDARVHALHVVGPQLADLLERLHATLTASGHGRQGQHKQRMTVEEANKKAMKVAHKMRAGFFALSERQQADLIGCSWKTWHDTPFYEKAQAKRPGGKRFKPRSPRTESLTPGREAVTGQGNRDEALHQLIADQQADHEPSPLQNDPAGRPRRVHFRKRL